jgi:hypothetical protein
MRLSALSSANLYSREQPRRGAAHHIARVSLRINEVLDRRDRTGDIS